MLSPLISETAFFMLLSFVQELFRERAELPHNLTDLFALEKCVKSQNKYQVCHGKYERGKEPLQPCVYQREDKMHTNGRDQRRERDVSCYSADCPLQCTRQEMLRGIDNAVNRAVKNAAHVPISTPTIPYGRTSAIETKRLIAPSVMERH